MPDHFDERQVALILQRTAELQRARDLSASVEREGSAVGQERGLSLAQLEQVAREAGIDPALVRRAALDVAASERTPRNPVLGEAVSIVVERTVPGAVPPERLDRVLEAIRNATHDLGEVSITGRSCGWRGRIDGAKAQVAASSDGARTTVRVQVALDETALGEFMTFAVGIGGVSGFLTIALTIDAIGGGLASLAALPVALAGYGLARYRYVRAAAGFRRRSAAVADAVADRIAALVERTAPIEAPAPSPGPLLHGQAGPPSLHLAPSTPKEADDRP